MPKVPANETAMGILKQICKVFFTSNQLKYTYVLRKQKETIRPWMAFFKYILELQVPNDLESYTDLPPTIQKRDKSTVWKLKFEAARIVHHLFNKYGMVDYVNDDEVVFH
jgi:hypothetical protein